MWLKLDLSGIKLSMQIRNYRKVSDDDWDSVWCKTDFAFVSDEWLNYRKDNDEVFLAREIEDLAKSLDDLLNDRGLILRSYMSDRAVKSLILIWSGKSRSWMKD